MSKQTIDSLLTIIDSRPSDHLKPCKGSSIPGFTAYYSMCRNKIYVCDKSKTINGTKVRCQCTITDKRYQKLDETIKAQLSNHSHIYPS